MRCGADTWEKLLGRRGSGLVDKIQAAHNWLIHDLVALNDWKEMCGGDNGEILDRLKVNLRYAFQHELTQKMQEYMLDYYVQGLSMREIARKRNVGLSAVSRGIKAARKNLIHVLRYTDPTLLTTKVRKSNRIKKFER